MTSFMPHPPFDSPASMTQASFEAFINQSPPTLSGPLMADGSHKSNVRGFSPQLPRSYLAAKFEPQQHYGHGQARFPMDYSSSGGSTTTASSHNADSPRDSAASQFSVSPDLSLHDHSQFDGVNSHDRQTSTNGGKLLDFEIDAQRQSSGMTSSGMWGASFEAHNDLASHQLVINTHGSSATSSSFPSDVAANSPVDDASMLHQAHARTNSFGPGALGIENEGGENRQSSWFHQPAKLNAGHQANRSNATSVQPLVLRNAPLSSNLDANRMSYGLGSIHSAPASMQNTFEIQSRMPPQPLPMSAAPIMANFSTNMIGQGPQPWINPSMIPATTQNTPMMTPVRKYSLDQNPSPALLTSAFAPSGSCMPSVLGHPQTNNHMFTPIEANAGAQGFHLLPNSAPANLSSSFVNHQAQNMIASTPTRVNKGLPVAGGNTVSMMAATASSAGDEDTGKTPKTVKRKRKADEGVPTLGISDLYAQAHFDHVEGNVGNVSSASVSTPVRERKPLPKRLPPSAFQKTEAGLPFPIVDTSAKHSTEFIYPDCTGLSKREARLVRNRAAAFLSRQRKREQHEELEVRCHALSRLVWHMYGNMMGNTEVPWDEAALRMGLTLPSSSSSGSGPSAMNGMQQQPQAPQELGLKLREEARTVLTAFEMVVKRKGATIGPLEGELPFEQGPPLGAAAAYVPSQTNGEPRLVNMLAEYGGGGDVEFDTDSDEQLQAQQQQQQQQQVQGDSSATPQRRRTR